MEEGRRPRCVSAFSPLGRYKAAEKAIILGTAFLQRYYTVFDLDLRTISSKVNLNSWAKYNSLKRSSRGARLNIALGL
jgi:Eukaryotic aspartyl protease